ncbi:MAG TPA: FliH/SctL family protein [Sphingomonas sp.]|nr:FliH/SctL family protein [Sphingomonas sp.]
MSNLMAADRVSEALRVPVWTRPADAARFNAWPREPAWQDEEEDEEGAEPFPTPPSVNIEAVRQQAFTEGYEAGIETGRREADAEREALRSLAASLETLKPEPVQALGAMLAATVERLVKEVMGEVRIDPETLLARAQAAAALIGEETRPSLLRLHPDDAARIDASALPVAIEADPAMTPGGLRLETGSGWIEDGPALRLEKLRAQLDLIAAAR